AVESIRERLIAGDVLLAAGIVALGAAVVTWLWLARGSPTPKSPVSMTLSGGRGGLRLEWGRECRLSRDRGASRAPHAAMPAKHSDVLPWSLCAGALLLLGCEGNVLSEPEPLPPELPSSGSPYPARMPLPARRPSPSSTPSARAPVRASQPTRPS